jgi:UDP-glucose 4-epimerase
VNILVTGGAGYIGSLATRRLLDVGHQVTVVDNLSTGYAGALDKRARFFRYDIGELQKMTELLLDQKIEAVMHFAAFIEVGESVQNPLKYYDNNVRKSTLLFEAMRQADVRRLVFSSTAAVYGEPQYLPLDENHPKQPINPYGSTKHMVEEILGDCARAYGLGFVALRYFNVAGAAIEGDIGEAHDPESHLIPRLLKVALGQSPSFDIYGTDYATPDGTCIRDYIHIEDLVAAHILALDHALPAAGGKFYNLGSEAGFSVKEVIESCRRVTKKPLQIQEKPRRAGDPARLVASSQKIQTELGWKLQYKDLDAIVSHAWNWHQRAPQGYK